MAETSRYRVIRPLGAGGSGRIWLAEDTSSPKQPVVLKRLHPNVDIELLSKEYDVLRSISHPHIAEVFDFQQQVDNGPFLVEQYIDGATITASVKDAPVEVKWRGLCQLLGALEHVHSKGIVHGDISPANVLVSDVGGQIHAYLIDFGLAARLSAADAGYGGTPGYMAPEVYRGEARTHRADLYSFGVLAYEVLAGCSAFPGTDNAEIIQAQLAGQTVSPSTHNHSLSARADAVLLALLEPEPAARPKTARDVMIELAAALELEVFDSSSQTLEGYMRSARLVGRDSVMAASARMRKQLFGNTPGGSQSSLLWLHGPSGSGRTRVLKQIAGDARIDGARVVMATEGGGPFDGIMTWLKGVGHTDVPWMSDSEPLSRLVASLDAIVEAVKDTPTVLCFDDLEVDNSQVTELLRIFSAVIETTTAPGYQGPVPKLAIVVTAGGPPPESIARYGCVHCHPLPTWTTDELMSWLQGLLPRKTALDNSVVDAIHHLTLGRPGFVVSLLGYWSRQGFLRLANGMIEVEADIRTAPIPGTLRQLLVERESTLEPNEAEVLQVVRVLERPAMSSVIAAALPERIRDQVPSCLTRLADAGFLTKIPSTAVQSISLYRAPTGDYAVDNERRKDIFAAAARAVMSTSSSCGAPESSMAMLARFAFRAVECGDTRLKAAGYRAARAALLGCRQRREFNLVREMLSITRALAPEGETASWTLELATDAIRQGKHQLASQYLTEVVNMTSETDPVRNQAVVAMARMQSDIGSYSDAVSLVARVTEVAAKAVEAHARMSMGEYAAAEAICETALQSVSIADEKAELRNILALVYYYTERMDLAVEQFEAAAAAFGALGDLPRQAQAVTGIGLIHHRRGAFEQALAAYSRSLELAQQSGDRRRITISNMNIGTVLQETGRLSEAVEQYRKAVYSAELLGDSVSVAKASNNLGNVLVEIGSLAEAEWWLTRSIDAAKSQNDRLLGAYARGILGRLKHLQGDISAARVELTTVAAELRELGTLGESGEILIELGLVARSAHDPDGMDHFAAAVEHAAKHSGAEKQTAWVTFLRGEALRIRGEPEAAMPLIRAALQLAEQTNVRKLSWRCDASLGRIYRELGNAMEARARFHASSERLLTHAGTLEGRLREAFLSLPERAAALEEARLAMSDSGTAPAQARESQERLLRLMEINRRLASERSPKRLLEFILDSAVQLTGAERGFLILRDDEDEKEDSKLNVRVARNIDRESLRRNPGRVSRSITRDVLETGEPIITVDAGEDSRYRHAASVHHLKLRSILCFPLRHQGRVVGAIYLDNRFQASTFSERDLDIIGAFGDQAAVAIENAWLFDSSEKARLALEASHSKIAALNDQLQSRLQDQAARLAQVETNLERQRNQLETRYSYDNIIGASVPMRRIFKVLDRVTDTSVPVLVQGESGTGKELVARAIHYNGAQRRNREFVSVNCAALTETLLESELFGHVKGAFTGADRDRKGLFEVADKGTLFLDELADMSLGMQAKLLRALQDGEVWPVGARRSIRVDVRIVAACNRDLSQMVESKEFRQDLYFRLNVVKIVLPPLRTRGEDLVMLTQHFLQQFQKKHRREIRLSQGALDLLSRFSWPGNVRELEATLTNACLFCDGDLLTEAHFSHKPELFEDDQIIRVRNPGDRPSRLGQELLDLGDMTLREIEERAILAALDRSDGNKVEAARRLGVTRQTLYNKLRSYGIEVHRRVRRADAE